MFLQKTPVPQEVATKHAFANALASVGVPLVKYEEMFNTENEERWAVFPFIKLHSLLSSLANASYLIQYMIIMVQYTVISSELYMHAYAYMKEI